MHTGFTFCKMTENAKIWIYICIAPEAKHNHKYQCTKSETTSNKVSKNNSRKMQLVKVRHSYGRLLNAMACGILHKNFGNSVECIWWFCTQFLTLKRTVMFRVAPNLTFSNSAEAEFGRISELKFGRSQIWLKLVFWSQNNTPVIKLMASTMLSAAIEAVHFSASFVALLFASYW